MGDSASNGYQQLKPSNILIFYKLIVICRLLFCKFLKYFLSILIDRMMLAQSGLDEADIWEGDPKLFPLLFQFKDILNEIPSKL